MKPSSQRTSGSASWVFCLVCVDVTLPLQFPRAQHDRDKDPEIPRVHSKRQDTDVSRRGEQGHGRDRYPRLSLVTPNKQRIALAVLSGVLMSVFKSQGFLTVGLLLTHLLKPS